ncbi:MAG: hypothetical protein H6766_05405 [Candidatus Peribacteria bacterium]|nr:MAG: hypothetical protein H6766_05405 [Candidatus Peribacteria bacterium]
MSPINIPSLKSWNEMSITLEIGSEDDIIVDILSCDDVILVDEVSLVGGNIDLSIIDPSETCIKPVITLLPPSNG